MRDKNRSYRNRPGREELQAYIDGNLSSERTEELEAYFNENPLANDALEGLKWIDEPQDISKRLKRINRHAQNKLLALGKPASPSSKRLSRVKPDFLLNPFIASMAGLAVVVLAWALIVRTSRPSNPMEEMGEISSVEVETGREKESTQEIQPSSPESYLNRADSTKFIAENRRDVGTTSRGATRTSPTRAKRRQKSQPNPSASQRRSLSIPFGQIPFEEDLEEDHFVAYNNSFTSYSSEPIPLSSQVIFLPGKGEKRERGLENPASVSMEVQPSFDRLKRRAEQDLQKKESKAKMSKMSLNPSKEMASETALWAVPHTTTRGPMVDHKKLSQLNLGIWYFTYDMYEEAEEELAELAQNDVQELENDIWAFSSTNWYLSQIYLSTGRKRKAKRLLEKISRYKNPYQIEAKDLLQRL